jgi:hypothetical protein
MVSDRRCRSWKGDHVCAYASYISKQAANSIVGDVLYAIVTVVFKIRELPYYR